jgi:hypothetical protein
VRRSARLLKQALSQTDERSKLEGEVIGGIDVIKCSAWEVRDIRFWGALLHRLQPLRLMRAPAAAKPSGVAPYSHDVNRPSGV